MKKFIIIYDDYRFAWYGPSLIWGECINKQITIISICYSRTHRVHLFLCKWVSNKLNNNIIFHVTDRANWYVLNYVFFLIMLKKYKWFTRLRCFNYEVLGINEWIMHQHFFFCWMKWNEKIIQIVGFFHVIKKLDVCIWHVNGQRISQYSQFWIRCGKHDSKESLDRFCPK